MGRPADELPRITEVPRGIKQMVTNDGITVIRIHYTADPDKDPATERGKKWLERALVGKPGGEKGKDWKSEMEIDFSVYSGKAVYPQFSEDLHVAKSRLSPIKGYPILRGWDAGLTPACSFSQLVPGRYLIFEGLHTSGREGVGITRFGQEVVEYSNLMFPGFKFQDYGDPALLQRSQVDERTCAQVLSTMGIHIIPGEVGSKARDNVMQTQFERLVDGVPFVQVCPSAIFMIEGFKGGFQYKRIGQTELYLSDHEKNDVSHVMEGQQYVASRIFQTGNPQGKKSGKKKSAGVMARRPDPRR